MCWWLGWVKSELVPLWSRKHVFIRSGSPAKMNDAYNCTFFFLQLFNRYEAVSAHKTTRRPINIKYKGRFIVQVWIPQEVFAIFELPGNTFWGIHPYYKLTVYCSCKWSWRGCFACNCAPTRSLRKHFFGTYGSWRGFASKTSRIAWPKWWTTTNNLLYRLVWPQLWSYGI